MLSQRGFKANLFMLLDPSINLTDSLSQITCHSEAMRRVVKALQNPIWAKQARARLKEIRILMALLSSF